MGNRIVDKIMSAKIAKVESLLEEIRWNIDLELKQELIELGVNCSQKSMDMCWYAFTNFLSCENFKNGIIDSKHLKTLCSSYDKHRMERFASLIDILQSENYKDGIIHEEHLKMIVEGEADQTHRELASLLAHKIFSFGFISKEHLSLIASDKYPLINRIINCILGMTDLDDDMKCSYILCLLNMNNKESVRVACDEYCRKTGNDFYIFLGYYVRECLPQIIEGTNSRLR